jgi:hypothetical protein
MLADGCRQCQTHAVPWTDASTGDVKDDSVLSFHVENSIEQKEEKVYESLRGSYNHHMHQVVSLLLSDTWRKCKRGARGRMREHFYANNRTDLGL